MTRKRTTLAHKTSLVLLLMLVSRTEANYTLGLLIPMTDADYPENGQYYASAMSIAVDAVNRQQNLLPGHNISFIWNDTACWKEDTTIRGLLHQMYEANVAAIIGPACLCNTSARIAASFDLPMISYVSTHFEFIRLDKCMIGTVLYCLPFSSCVFSTNMGFYQGKSTETVSFFSPMFVTPFP